LKTKHLRIHNIILCLSSRPPGSLSYFTKTGMKHPLPLNGNELISLFHF